MTSRRAIVAMSGGVDSSVVAALLHEQGFEVIGITLQLYDHGAIIQKAKACCAGQDIADAKAVADTLGIAHYTFDYESRFKQAVMDTFADSYLRGETPIPCVQCNQTIKFRDLLEVARDLGGEFLATGHYVQRIEGSHGPELHQGFEATKDQSYFLFQTTKHQLDFLRFPLGGQTKTQTRALASRFGLSVADKPDSQDICFVPNGDYASIVAKLRPEAHQPGDIVLHDGTVIGKHEGIAHFTIGQRRGIGIGGGEPLYVLRLDPDTRRVVVGRKEYLGQTALQLTDLNWLGDTPIPAEGFEGVMKIRSAKPPVSATLYPDGRVVFAAPQEAIAPGQAGVIYRGTRCMGGGWIKRSPLQ
jgi:tRNA-specific 2-thiouridylase